MEEARGKHSKKKKNETQRRRTIGSRQSDFSEMKVRRLKSKPHCSVSCLSLISLLCLSAWLLGGRFAAWYARPAPFCLHADTSGCGGGVACSPQKVTRHPRRSSGVGRSPRNAKKSNGSESAQVLDKVLPNSNCRSKGRCDGRALAFFFLAKPKETNTT